MTCKDCIYKEACNQHLDEINNPKFTCATFKDRSKFIESPCKVGDTLYIIQRKRITVHKVSSLSIGIDNILWINIKPITGYLFAGCYIDDIGKTVFLTKEQAKQALKEREQE